MGSPRRRTSSFHVEDTGSIRFNREHSLDPFIYRERSALDRMGEQPIMYVDLLIGTALGRLPLERARPPHLIAALRSGASEW